MSACKNCLWCDQCGQEFACNNFSPIEENIDEIIEENRYTFREEWNKYITRR